MEYNKNKNSIFEMYNMFWYYPESHTDSEPNSYFNGVGNTLNEYKIPAIILYPAFLTPAVIQEGKPLHIMLAVKEEKGVKLSIADVNAQLKFTVGLDSYKCVNREPLFESLENDEIKIKEIKEWTKIKGTKKIQFSSGPPMSVPTFENNILSLPGVNGIVYGDIVKMYQDSGYKSLYSVEIKNIWISNKDKIKREGVLLDEVASKVTGNIKENEGERLNRYTKESQGTKKGVRSNPLRPVEKSDKFVRRVLKEMNGDGLKQSGMYSQQKKVEFENPAHVFQQIGKYKTIKREIYREEWDEPIQSYHPLFIHKKEDKYWKGGKHYGIAHMADIHVSSRQELMSLSKCRVIEYDKAEDVSPELGKLLSISSQNVKEFFDKAGKNIDVDMILIGGDVIDHIPNIPINDKNLNDIKKGDNICIKKLWKKLGFSTSTSIRLITSSPQLTSYDDNEHYQDFIDAIYLFSMLLDFYHEFKKPIYLVSGNHDAYQAPYGLSPRPLGIRANAGIPADHNLTFYEAILLYGEGYKTVGLSTRMMKRELFNWLFSVFTPFSDYALELSKQIMVGVHWGDDEDLTDVATLPGFTAEGQEMAHLPRSNEAVSDLQLKFLKKIIAGKGKKKIILSTHFTFLCYKEQIPYLAREEAALVLDDTPLEPETSEYSLYEMGTFETNRKKVYNDILKEIDCIFTGHSHRRGLYKVTKVSNEKGKEVLGNFFDLSTAGYSGAVKEGMTKEEKADFKAWNFKGDKKIGKADAKMKYPPIIVSDSLGPLPRYNKKGEFCGWGSDYPSGTKVIFNQKDGNIKAIELIRPNNSCCKPRFVVALDYWDILEMDNERETSFNWKQLDMEAFRREKSGINLLKKYDTSNAKKLAEALNKIVSTKDYKDIHDEKKIDSTIESNLHIIPKAIKYLKAKKDYENNRHDRMKVDLCRASLNDSRKRLNFHIIRELVPNTTKLTYPVLGKIVSESIDLKGESAIHEPFKEIKPIINLFINFSPFLYENGVGIKDISLFSYNDSSFQMHFNKEKISEYKGKMENTPGEFYKNFPKRCIKQFFSVKVDHIENLIKRISEKDVDYVYKKEFVYDPDKQYNIQKEFMKSSKKYLISIKFNYDDNDEYKLFKQYDFDSRWNFPVDIKLEDGHLIIERDKDKAEITDLDWYKKQFKKYQ